MYRVKPFLQPFHFGFRGTLSPSCRHPFRRVSRFLSIATGSGKRSFHETVLETISGSAPHCFGTVLSRGFLQGYLRPCHGRVSKRLRKDFGRRVIDSWEGPDSSTNRNEGNRPWPKPAGETAPVSRPLCHDASATVTPGTNRLHETLPRMERHPLPHVWIGLIRSPGILRTPDPFPRSPVALSGRFNPKGESRGLFTTP